MPCRRGAVPCQPLATVIGGVGAAPVAARHGHGHVNPSSPFPCDGHARSVDQRRQVLGVHGLGRRGRRWSVAPGTHAARLTRRWTTPRRRCGVRAVGGRSAAGRAGHGEEGVTRRLWPGAATRLLFGAKVAGLTCRPLHRSVRPAEDEEEWCAAEAGTPTSLPSRQQATPPCTSAWPHQGRVDDPMSTTWTRISLPCQKAQFPALDGGHRSVLDTCGICTGPIGS